mmetsp:Transcript_11567/g.48583  ORF Transcript_11567/g.48583 Transcript_11567/m.48583 type:complete len:258 (+) Transcript_11567:819-1592(+)
MASSHRPAMGAAAARAECRAPCLAPRPVVCRATPTGVSLPSLPTSAAGTRATRISTRRRAAVGTVRMRRIRRTVRTLVRAARTARRWRAAWVARPTPRPAVALMARARRRTRWCCGRSLTAPSPTCSSTATTQERSSTFQTAAHAMSRTRTTPRLAGKLSRLSQRATRHETAAVTSHSFFFEMIALRALLVRGTVRCNSKGRKRARGLGREGAPASDFGASSVSRGWNRFHVKGHPVDACDYMRPARARPFRSPRPA